MNRTILTVTAFALLAFVSDSSAQNVCTSQQPGPINGQPWFCAPNGQWLPPGHPSIPTNTTPQPGPAPAPIPIPQPNPDGFHLGHTYRRTATGTRIYIMSLGQDVRGFYAFTGQCLDESTEDHCYGIGSVLLVYAHYGRAGWEDLGPYPDGVQF